jgi:hypothetical protein
MSKDTIAGRVCYAAPVFPNDPVEDRASFSQSLERADLVSTHQAAVAFDIRCEDSHEASTDCHRVGHVCPNANLWRPVWG